METMQIDVLLFSVLKEKIGVGRTVVTLQAPATGGDLIGHLEERYPAIAGYRSVIRLAVNEAYTDTNAVLSDGDEVALITPVSGG